MWRRSTVSALVQTAGGGEGGVGMDVGREVVRAPLVPTRTRVGRARGAGRMAVTGMPGGTAAAEGSVGSKTTGSCSGA